MNCRTLLCCLSFSLSLRLPRSYQALTSGCFCGWDGKRARGKRDDGQSCCGRSNKAGRRCQNRSGASCSHRRRFSSCPRMNPPREASAETSCHSGCCRSGKDTAEERSGKVIAPLGSRPAEWLASPPLSPPPLPLLRLSAFLPSSDISDFHLLSVGVLLELRPHSVVQGK